MSVIRHFDMFSPEENPAPRGPNPYQQLGWAAWTGAGLYALSKTSVGPRLASYLGKALRGEATLPTRAAIGEGLKGFLHRPHPVLQDVIEANSLHRFGRLRGQGLPLENTFRSISARRTGDGLTLGELRALPDNVIQTAHPRLRQELETARQALTGLENQSYRFSNTSLRSLDPDFQHFLQTPIRGLKSAAGKLSDSSRYTEPGMIPHLLESFKLPDWMFSGQWAQNYTGALAPLRSAMGVMENLKGLQRPFKWAADLLAPVDLLRDQRNFQVFRGPSLGHRGGTRYLVRGLEDDRRNVIERLWFSEGTNKPSGKTDWRFIPATEATIPQRDPTRLYRAGISPVESSPGELLTNQRIVAADSSVGKGARIFLQDYQHSVNRYLTDFNFNPNGLYAKTLQRLDKLGIGPHLTSPDYNQGFRSGKPGIVQRAIRAVYEKAGVASPIQGTPTTGGPPLDRAFAWVNEVGLSPRGIQGLSHFMNYLVMRPMALFEELTGLGIKPGKTAADSMLRILTRAALPGYMLFQGSRYLDYKLEQATGVSPFKTALDAYAGTQVAFAGARDALGIREASQRAEEYFPGSVSSPLSTIGRSVGVPFFAFSGLAAAGARLGGMAPGPLKWVAPIAGAAAGTMFGMTDWTLSAEQTARRYSGEEPVAMRRGRFWEMGRSGYFGDDIQYFRPHMISLMRTAYLEKSIYGSEKAYWETGTAFPTPENLFGLRRILQGDYAEKRNQDSRPYPLRSRGFGGDIPIIGPTLEGITSTLFGYEEHPRLQESLANYAPPGRTGMEPGYMTAAGLYGEPGLGTPVNPRRPGEFSQVLGKQLSNIQDWFGMPGFLAGAIKDNVLGGGRDAFAGDPQLQTSSRMGSTESWFYDTLNVGGMLGQSEFIRRFIPRRRTQLEEVNPIPNTMPEWLPGSRSIFAKDREYPIDAQTGDPFIKFPTGEARLPGKGYEAIRPLHSGTPGVYDAVDRLLILGDLFPYSDAYKHYKTIVDMWMKAGAIDQYWSRQVIEAKSRVDQKQESKRFGTPNLMEAPPIEPITVTPTEVLSSGRFRAAEFPQQTFQLAGIERKKETSIYKMLSSANAASVDEARAKVEELHGNLSDRMQAMIGRQVEVQVSRDQAAKFNSTGDVLAIVPGLNQNFFRSGIGASDQPGMAAHLRGGPVTRVLGNAYYGVASQDLPFPFGWPKNKLLPVRSPVDDYYQFQVQGSKISRWEDPIGSFAVPWARSWVNWALPGDQVPDSFRDRQEIDRRFQALEYIKASRGLMDARAGGDSNQVKYWQKRMEQTPAGLNTASPRSLILYGHSSVAPWERGYIDSFENLTSTADRERAIQLASPALGNVLMNKWSMRQREEFDSPTLETASQFYKPGQFKQAALAGVSGSPNLPGHDWAGWHPQVDLNAVKIRYLDRTGEDYHHFGMWESQQRQFNRLFPDIDVPDVMDLGNVRINAFDDNMRRESNTYQSSTYSGYGMTPEVDIYQRVSSLPVFKSSLRKQDYRLSSSLYRLGY